ncbi:MAG: hypothetical protein DRO15_06000 [Thermoprotei archaeon]|nr:MAG: hypothetical protein DRO15_06000 [Thermoprotei archaeon]
MSKKISILNLEGLALNGLIKSYSVVNCDEENKVKIVAQTELGEEVETPCFDKVRLSTIMRILESYKAWGKSILTKEAVEIFIIEEERREE